VEVRHVPPVSKDSNSPAKKLTDIPAGRNPSIKDSKQFGLDRRRQSIHHFQGFSWEEFTMRLVGRFIVLASLLAASAAAADDGACVGQMKAVVSSSPYFSQEMVAQPSERQGQLTFRHKDDARVIASFETKASPPIAGLSRSAYVGRLKEYADAYVAKVKDAGRWGESSVFPYEPMAWRTVEETAIPSVGDALVGHMEMRLSAQCTMITDFISPSSLTLRSRWSAMTGAVSDMRSTAAAQTTAEEWAPEDTNPVGIQALAAGFAVPLAVAVFVYLLLSRLIRFESPAFPVRAVIGGSALASLSALAFQSGAFTENVATGRFVDTLLLLLLSAGTSVAGAVLGHRAGTFAVVYSTVAGVSIAISASFGWTPAPSLNLVFGAAMAISGIAAGYLWVLFDNGFFNNVKRG
jgi:hypothetical protein